VWLNDYLNSRTPSAELNSRLGIERLSDVVRRSRLQCFGHVERKDSDDWVSACRSLKLMEAWIGRLDER